VPVAAQQRDQLGLTRDGAVPQDADDRVAALGLGVEVGRHRGCIRTGE
jgi:hypothetical protein